MGDRKRDLSHRGAVVRLSSWAGIHLRNRGSVVSRGWVVALVALLFFSGSDGFAAETNAGENETKSEGSHTKIKEKGAEKKISITWAPVHLVYPIVELTVEGRLPFDFAIAGIVGGGAHETWVWEAGVQGRYYLLGDFEHGMPIILEVLYLGGAESSLETSAMLGYKLTLDIGLTADVAAGASWSSLRGGEARYDPVVTPVVNLNIGWSF